MKSLFYFQSLLFSLLLFSCKDTSNVNTLSKNLNANNSSLTNTIQTIKTDPALEILDETSDDIAEGVLSPTKSIQKIAEISSDSITLQDILGEYNYNKSSEFHKQYPNINRLFCKTAEKNILMIKFPESKLAMKRLFYTYIPSDTLLTNNFILNVTEYENIFKSNYTSKSVSASIIAKGQSYGTISIKRYEDLFKDNTKLSVTYSFTNGLTISTQVQNYRDSICQTYKIYNSSTTYFEEYSKSNKIYLETGLSFAETNYKLSIGKVSFEKKNIPTGNIRQLRINGNIYSTASFITINKPSPFPNFSILSRNKDIEITFEDGTKRLLSSIIGPEILDANARLRRLLQTCQLNTYIVDKVALEIYSTKQ